MSNITVEEMRQRLDHFSDSQDSCNNCVLKSPVCECGNGVHFLTKNSDGTYAMSDEEIIEAYNIAFKNKEV